MGSDRRTLNEFLAGLVFLGLVAAVPFVVSNAYWQGVIVLSTYFAIQAGAWNLLAGYTGQFSLAPAAFGMIGAYATGLLCEYAKLPPLLSIPCAVIIAGAIGLALGRIALRLKGPYLALTTLSFAEIMRLVASNSINITRGDLGLAVPGLFGKSCRLALSLPRNARGAFRPALFLAALTRWALLAGDPR